MLAGPPANPRSDRSAGWHLPRCTGGYGHSEVPMFTRQLVTAYSYLRASKIARLRVGLTLLGALVACSGDANPITGPSSNNFGPATVTPVTVASVTLSLPSSSIALGESAQSSAIAKDINGNPIAGQFFNWSSSDSTIVTVSSSGFAVGVGIGSATITAAAGIGMNGVATENVVGGAPIASIAVMPTQVNVGLGQTTQFAVTLFDAAGNVLSGRRVVWMTSDSSIMQVSSTGTGTPKGRGTVAVTVKGAGVTGTATAVVASATTPAPAPGTVTDVSVVSTTDTSATLTFTQVADGLGNAASYDVRYAVAPLAWTTATSVTRGSCATPVAGITVGSPLTCIVFGLTANAAYQFAVVAFRGTLNTNAVLGSPSNTASATTPLTPVASVTVTPTAPTAVVGSAGVQFSAVAKDASGNVLAGRPIAWNSGNTSVATISPTGLETSAGVGATTITATSGTVSGTTTLTVTAAAPQPTQIG